MKHQHDLVFLINKAVKELVLLIIVFDIVIIFVIIF